MKRALRNISREFTADSSRANDASFREPVVLWLSAEDVARINEN